MAHSSTFFVPYLFASLPQEPKSASDTPAGVAHGGNTAAPGGPNPTPSPGPGGGGDMFFLYMGLIVLALYFMMLRPEQKRKKALQSMLSAVKQGDRVVTVGGMHGTVMNLTEKTVTLRVDTVKMVLDRVAIARVERDETQGGEASKT
ncbi:MAG TPA: preprotein translocase subunit YajC [Planctomycetota bacterium]|nr:preprotein translocase subunit YajC [Planctomycetota bacterium]